MWYDLKHSLNLFREERACQKAIVEVLKDDTYRVGSGYPHLKILEDTLSRMLGDVPVVCTNSGTDALILSLKILGIGPGDEVIVPAFGFVSMASAVGWVGAKPVFVDIGGDDYGLDPSLVLGRITNQTRAIVIAHLFGGASFRIQEIVDIARQHNLFVVEDAAQAFGTKVKIDGEWKFVGTIGDVGCLSFSSAKALSAPGSAGALVIKDVVSGETARLMRFYGTKRHYYEYPVLGTDCIMHEIHAAALLSKLPFLRFWMEHRYILAGIYTERLARVKDIILPRVDDNDIQHTWYRYVIRTPRRDELFDYVSNLGLLKHLKPVKIYPVPMPYFSVFKGLGYKTGDFPRSEAASREAISLPLENFISRREADRLCNIILPFLDGAV